MIQKKVMAALALAMMSGMVSHAQEIKESAGPDLTGDMTTAPAVHREDVVGKDGQAEWYINMDYAGYEFELPAGIMVDKGSSFVAKYPDGSFGLSMSNESEKGTNQKIAFEICRRMATELKIPNPHVDKVKYGKCNGAKATGELEGSKVTILVLPYDGEQVTTVMLATPERSEWVDHFLRTLKR